MSDLRQGRQASAKMSADDIHSSVKPGLVSILIPVSMFSTMLPVYAICHKFQRFSTLIVFVS
jgi:hypothetical protein